MRIDALEIDDEVEEHLARHGVRAWELWEVIANAHLVRQNPRRADRVHIIGSTHGGRILTASMASTDDEGMWRPVTAFPAGDADARIYRAKVLRQSS